jgi:hypothetical protein
MSGHLGSREILGNVAQAIYVNDNTKASIVTVNILNRNSVDARVSIAVSSSQTTPANYEWVEYNTVVSPTATLERSAVMVSPGQYVVIKSDVSYISASCWGITSGTTVAVAPITVQLGSVPVWSTTSPLPDIYGGTATSTQLVASDTDVGQALSYSVTSGTLPTGLTLSETGLLSGTPTGGYVSDQSSTFTVSVTDGAGVVPRVFSITKKWFDGLSSGNAGASAEAIKGITGTTTNGLYWIKPVGAASAEQVYCIMDNSVGDSGGWMSAFNILSNSNSGLTGGAADWFNTAFWDTQTSMNTGTTLTSNFKTNVYGYAPIRKVNVLLHNISTTSFKGWGAYELNGSNISKSLYQLCGGGTGVATNDEVVASNGRKYAGGIGSGCIRNTLRNQSEYGDLFVDPSTEVAHLLFRGKGQWASDGGETANMVRISTTLGNSNNTYGHTFAGIGGTHQNAGWRGDFAMAPVSAYCDNPQSYGDRTDGVNMTSYSGQSYPYTTSCTTNTNAQFNVGYCLLVK